MSLLLHAPAARRRRPLPQPVLEPPEPPPGPESPQPGHGGWFRRARLLLLATCLLFCHPCHGDEDDEPGVQLPAQRDGQQQERPRHAPPRITPSP
jgi:hypothetical protein